MTAGSHLPPHVGLPGDGHNSLTPTTPLRHSPLKAGGQSGRQVWVGDRVVGLPVSATFWLCFPPGAVIGVLPHNKAGDWGGVSARCHGNCKGWVQGPQFPFSRLTGKWKTLFGLFSVLPALEKVHRFPKVYRAAVLGLLPFQPHLETCP